MSWLYEFHLQSATAVVETKDVADELKTVFIDRLEPVREQYLFE